MTDHEKFKALLDEVGLSYRELADLLGLTYDSLKNQVAPGKNLPKWAKSMLIVSEFWKNKK